MIGEGVGATAALIHPGDELRFYEINPQVIELAGGRGGYFHFLEGLSPPVEITEGDARLSLERELREGQRRSFDLLAIDAFSGDSIPVHLLTQEAVALYLQQLRPGGILAFHVTNHYLSLPRVVFGEADRLHLHTLHVVNSADPGNYCRREHAEWILLTADPTIFDDPAFARPREKIDDPPPAERVVWTDDRSDIFGVMKRQLTP